MGYMSVQIIICLRKLWGGEVELPEDEPPRLVRHAAATIEEALELEPLDIRKGRISVILKATEICRKKVGNEIFVKTCIDSAPFSAAAALLGPEEWMISLIDEPELCKKMLELTMESVVRYGKAAAQAGALGLAFGDSVAGLLNREMYREFAFPYVRETIAALHENTKLPVFYHVCGNTSHILDLMVETGADCIEIDSQVPMKLAKEAAFGRCAVEGNVSTIEAFLQGGPEVVRKEAYEILDLFGNKGGLILSSACEIPRKTPMESVRALTEAVRSYPL